MWRSVLEECGAAAGHLRDEVDEQPVDLLAGEQLTDDAHAVHDEDVAAFGAAQLTDLLDGPAVGDPGVGPRRVGHRGREHDLLDVVEPAGDVAIPRVSRLVERDRGPVPVEALVVEATQERGRGPDRKSTSLNYSNLGN